MKQISKLLYEMGKDGIMKIITEPHGKKVAKYQLYYEKRACVPFHTSF